MRNGSYEQSNVDTVARKLPAARALLREAGIDSTSRLSLREAALACGTNPDELLAQVEARLRRQIGRLAQQHPTERRAFEELELELAY